MTISQSLWVPSEQKMSSFRSETVQRRTSLLFLSGTSFPNKSDGSGARALAVCFLSLVTTKCFYRCDDSRGKLVVDPCREALFCKNCRGLLWVLGCARAEDRVPRARNRYSGLSGIAGDPRTHKSSIILAPGHQWQPLAGLAGCWALPAPPPATST